MAEVQCLLDAQARRRAAELARALREWEPANPIAERALAADFFEQARADLVLERVLRESVK